MHERRFSGDIARLRSAERIERLEVTRVVQLCLEGEGFSNMLDAGTGSGLFAEVFASHNLEVTGIDANPGMLPAARGYIPQGSFVQATVEAFPFAARSYDLTFFGLVLHEADDPLSVLKGAHRVSRKRACVLEWPYRAQDFGPPMEDRMNPSMLEELFQQAGFSRWECTPLTHTDLYRLEV